MSDNVFRIEIQNIELSFRLNAFLNAHCEEKEEIASACSALRVRAMEYIVSVGLNVTEHEMVHKQNPFSSEKESRRVVQLQHELEQEKRNALDMSKSMQSQEAALRENIVTNVLQDIVVLEKTNLHQEQIKQLEKQEKDKLEFIRQQNEQHESSFKRERDLMEREINYLKSQLAVQNDVVSKAVAQTAEEKEASFRRERNQHETVTKNLQIQLTSMENTLQDAVSLVTQEKDIAFQRERDGWKRSNDLLHAQLDLATGQTNSTLSEFKTTMGQMQESMKIFDRSGPTKNKADVGEVVVRELLLKMFPETAQVIETCQSATKGDYWIHFPEPGLTLLIEVKNVESSHKNRDFDKFESNVRTWFNKGEICGGVYLNVFDETRRFQGTKDGVITFLTNEEDAPLTQKKIPVATIVGAAKMETLLYSTIMNLLGCATTMRNGVVTTIASAAAVQSSVNPQWSESAVHESELRNLNIELNDCVKYAESSHKILMQSKQFYVSIYERTALEVNTLYTALQRKRVELNTVMKLVDDLEHSIRSNLMTIHPCSFHTRSPYLCEQLSSCATDIISCNKVMVKAAADNNKVCDLSSDPNKVLFATELHDINFSDKVSSSELTKRKQQVEDIAGRHKIPKRDLKGAKKMHDELCSHCPLENKK